MTKHNQDGAVSGVGISLVIAIVLLLTAIGFGGWAFTSRQDYKDNSDAKSEAAVAAAKAQLSDQKDKEAAEKEKSPLRTYTGPEAYGSIVLKYPKTWSGYNASSASTSSNNPVDTYFAPNVVPSITDKDSVFALRVQVVSQPYAQVLQQISQDTQHAPTISAYSLPRLPKVVGVKAVGSIDQKDNVTMVVLPLRSQTLRIWTEGNQYLDDFNNFVLKEFSFSP
jgi:hypothetical protein